MEEIMPAFQIRIIDRNWGVGASSAVFLLAALFANCAVFAADDGFTQPAAQAEARRLAAEPPRPPPRDNRIVMDRSGRSQAGVASIYAHAFDGRRMANGRRYNPASNVAASKSLPLGTIAKVTNLKTGKSTEVRVEDRGPFIAGRVVDLTPQAARQIGLTDDEGIAPVVVAPVAVPQPDGTLKPGAGAVRPAEEVAEAPDVK
jgi:rare lipoprotein A